MGVKTPRRGSHVCLSRWWRHSQLPISALSRSGGADKGGSPLAVLPTAVPSWSGGADKGESPLAVLPTALKNRRCRSNRWLIKSLRADKSRCAGGGRLALQQLEQKHSRVAPEDAARESQADCRACDRKMARGRKGEKVKWRCIYLSVGLGEVFVFSAGYRACPLS